MEFVCDLSVMLALDNELGNIVDVHLQVPNRLDQPFFSCVDSGLGHLGQEKFNLIVECLGCGLQLGLDFLGV